MTVFTSSFTESVSCWRPKDVAIRPTRTIISGNLIKGYKPNGINKLWIADITYIDTDSGVCYLNLQTDAFSHEIISWPLSEPLWAKHSLGALNLDKFKGYPLQVYVKLFSKTSSGK